MAAEGALRHAVISPPAPADSRMLANLPPDKQWMRPYFRWGFWLGTVGVILVAAGIGVSFWYGWVQTPLFIVSAVPGIALLAASVTQMFRLASRARREVAMRPPDTPLR